MADKKNVIRHTVLNISTNWSKPGYGCLTTNLDNLIAVNIPIASASLYTTFCPSTDSYQDTILKVYREWYVYMIGNGFEFKTVDIVKQVVSKLIKPETERASFTCELLPQTMQDMIERSKDQEYDKYLLPIYMTLHMVTLCYDAEITP